MMADVAANERQAVDSCRSALAGRLASGTLKLPVLPKVAGQVMTMTADPDADLAELSTLIHRDQALAGHVLRIANSAAYGSSVPIVSLQQAVTRLGMKLLSEIAIALSVQNGTFRVPAFQTEVARIWRHALASGTYGKEVARMKRHNVEGQFLCGLLHTIGKPVAWQAISDWQESQHEVIPLPLARELANEFHCAIGQIIAQNWKLPQQVQICCLSYRRYADVTVFREETAMTYLSDQLAILVSEPDENDGSTLKHDPVLVALNLYPDEVDELLAKREVVSAVVNAMEI